MTERAGVVVARFSMPPGTRFAYHRHRAHQLAWASTGVLTVTTEQATWILPPTRALWIPAHRSHEVGAADGATMTATYLLPSHSSLDWTEPTPVRVGGLLREMIGYLGNEGLDAGRRERAERLLLDLLDPVATTTIDLRMPTDARALDVAHALQADPADCRSLGDWGSQVGASSRTLARAFLVDTGIPFGRWRRLLRVQAALSALASGETVGIVARSVGYNTPSAFVAAFRREIGSTPAAYFKPGRCK